jgi:hypothetical protein
MALIGNDPKFAPRPGRTDEATVVVYHGEEALDGSGQIEPEEQLAEIVQPMPALVTIGNGPMREDVPLESLPPEIQRLAGMQQAHIAHQLSAGELADSSRTRCAGCTFFDQQSWAKIVRDAESAGQKDQLLELNMTHAFCNEQGIDLYTLGICKALTEHLKETHITAPLGSCPDDQPFFFKPRKELDARRLREAGYDWIMNRAAKGPK